MPGFAAHYLFGTETFKELPDNKLKRMIKEHRTVFGLGLQGPDLFFYYPPCYIHKVNIGSVMHRSESKNFITAMADRCGRLEGQERETAFAYLCGFLGHYALDKRMHPYVYAKTGFDPGRKKDTHYYETHFELETKLDTIWLREKMDITPARFHACRTIGVSRMEEKTIGCLLSETLTRVYRMEYSPRVVRLAIRSMKAGTRLLHDGSGHKKRFAKMIHRLTGSGLAEAMIAYGEPDKAVAEAVLNERKEEWANPWDRSVVSRETAGELYDKAKLEYMDYLRLMAEAAEEGGGDFQKLLDRISDSSYHSGLKVTVHREQ